MRGQMKVNNMARGAIQNIDIEEELFHADELSRQRFSYNEFLKGQTTELAEKLAAKLNRMIAEGEDTQAFVIATSLAVAKDSLDVILTFTGIGLIPIVGALPGIFLWVVLYTFTSGKGYFKKFKLRLAWWILGLFVDNLPLFSALPVNTLVVLYAWRVTRKRGSAARENLDRLHQSTAEELEKIDTELGEDEG